MQPSARKFSPWLASLAMVGGIGLGLLLGTAGRSHLWAEAITRLLELGGMISLAWLQALAVPLIFSSLLLGGMGLEPMRRMGTLAGKTIIWMLGSTLLAVLVGFAATFLCAPFFGEPGFPEQVPGIGMSEIPSVVWGWLGLVTMSFAFGYYRNQIDEGYGRMFTRFCQGIEAMLAPLLPWTMSLAAVSIFCLATSLTAGCISQRGWISYLTPMVPGLFERIMAVLLFAAVAYVLGLCLVVWVATRVTPWRYGGGVWSAMLLAASGQSMEAALPMTINAMRRHAGVSNRVAGVVLSLGAALHRDGIALGWVVVTLCSSPFDPGVKSWPNLACVALIAVVMGCGLSAIAQKGRLFPFLFLSVSHWRQEVPSTLVFGCLIVAVGNAVSVFSQACATVIIARGEGEYWVPGTPPTADELQGLKNDLELAEG